MAVTLAPARTACQGNSPYSMVAFPCEVGGAAGEAVHLVDGVALCAYHSPYDVAPVADAPAADPIPTKPASRVTVLPPVAAWDTLAPTAKPRNPGGRGSRGEASRRRASRTR